jgi:PhnB protein
MLTRSRRFGSTDRGQGLADLANAPGELSSQSYWRYPPDETSRPRRAASVVWPRTQTGDWNSMKIHPYLNFDNRTEEAFRFYAKALGGKLTEIHRFGSMPQQDGFELTPEQKRLVMHVGLELPDGQMIMASDMIAGMSPRRVEGNNIAISVHPNSRQEADRVFNALAQGGTITMPIADQFWGDYYGSLTDRFGINWMVNYSDPTARRQ